MVRKSIPIADEPEGDAQWLSKSMISIGDRTAEKSNSATGARALAETIKDPWTRCHGFHQRSSHWTRITSHRPCFPYAPSRVVGGHVEDAPELSADIMDRGLLLCGGASQIPGLDQILRETYCQC